MTDNQKRTNIDHTRLLRLIENLDLGKQMLDGTLYGTLDGNLDNAVDSSQQLPLIENEGAHEEKKYWTCDKCMYEHNHVGDDCCMCNDGNSPVKRGDLTSAFEVEEEKEEMCPRGHSS